MEKESKIAVQKQRTKSAGLKALCALLPGYIVFVILQGVEVIPHFHFEPTYVKAKVKKTLAPVVHKNKEAWIPSQSLPELERIVQDLDEEVRAIKKTKVIMETDPTSIQKTADLKTATRNLLKAKYGDHDHYRVQLDLEFPPSIPGDKTARIVLEMAPLEYQPVSVYNFLEIARTWIRGAFHRNADHVLQVQVVSDAINKPLPFQEYSKEFPHRRGTTGYAGRPSGPGWYVSIADNTQMHGPGSQQKHNPYEADANFGRVVEGMDDVIPRIHSVKQNGWLDAKNQIKIVKKTILIPDGHGGFKKWHDWTKPEEGGF